MGERAPGGNLTANANYEQVGMAAYICRINGCRAKTRTEGGMRQHLVTCHGIRYEPNQVKVTDSTDLPVGVKGMGNGH